MPSNGLLMNFWSVGVSEPVADTPFQELPPWHQEPWRRFREMVTHKRLAHALLLNGPQGVGKAWLAKRLAAALVCESEQVSDRPCGKCRSCTLSQGDTHPDIHWVAPEEEGKSIRIDAIREMIGRSTLTTQSRGLRVFVISPAEAMNRAAANALLKTLEEPVPSSVLVLVTSAPHRLPATILSRCQRIDIRPVDMGIASSWLKKRVNPDDAGIALALAGGAPLLAQQFVQEGRVEQVMGLLDDLVVLKQRKANPVMVAAQWKALGVERVLDGLRRILSDLLRLTSRNTPRMLPSTASENLQVLMKNINLRKIYGFMDELNRLERQLGNNLNAQMLTEKLVTTWLATTRAENH